MAGTKPIPKLDHSPADASWYSNMGAIEGELFPFKDDL